MREDTQSAFDAAGAIEYASAAENAIQQLCRATLAHPGMVTPADVDIVVAHLAAAAAALPQAARQLGDILAQANNDYELQMDNLTETADPELAIETARLHLDAAREPALDLYRLLDAAHQETAHIAVTDQLANQPDDLLRNCASLARRPEDRQPHRWAVEPVFRDDRRLSEERPRGQTVRPLFRCMRAGIGHRRHYLQAAAHRLQKDAYDRTRSVIAASFSFVQQSSVDLTSEAGGNPRPGQRTG
jgi:hypothetical protein